MKLWDFFRLLVAVWMCGTPQIAALVNRRVGIHLQSYANLDGKLPDGTCCDGQTLAGNSGCVPDSCDTVFVYCLKRRSDTSSCVANMETTAIINNNTVTQFGSRLDPHVHDSSPSLVVMTVTTMEDLVMEIEVVEVDPPDGSSRGTKLGVFHLPINSTQIFSHLLWNTYSFNNSVVSLGVKVTSFCNKNFYGPSCDVSCRPLDNILGHFTCDDDGNKVCKQGYTGIDCTDIIDLCVLTIPQPVCHNGATCHPVLNNYTCTCAPGFTGRLCDVRTPTTPGTTLSKTSSTSTSTSTSSTTTTTTTTTTTSKATKMSPSTSSRTSPSPSSSSTSSSTLSTMSTTITTSATTSSSTKTSPSALARTSAAASTSSDSTASSPILSSTKMSPSTAPQSQEDTTRGQTIALVLGPLAAILCIAAAAMTAYKLMRRKRERNVKPKKLEEENPPEKDVKKAWETEPQLETNQHPPDATRVIPKPEVDPPLPVVVVEW